MKPRTKEEHAFEQKTLSDGIVRDIDDLIGSLERMRKAVGKDNFQVYQMPTNAMLALAIRWGQLCEMQRLSYVFQDGA